MQPDYALIRQLLTTAAPELSPANLHGAVTGYLCSGATLDIDVFNDLFETELPGVVRQLLERLGNTARDELAQTDYVFQPLLPADEASLGERLAALGQWCDCFNIGFSAGYMQPQTPLSVDVMEVLNDFGQLAEVEAPPAAVDTDDEDENYYMELVEFVRMAAITVFQQLQDAQPPGAEDAADDLPEQLFADPDERLLH